MAASGKVTYVSARPGKKARPAPGPALALPRRPAGLSEIAELRPDFELTASELLETIKDSDILEQLEQARHTYRLSARRPMQEGVARLNLYGCDVLPGPDRCEWDGQDEAFQELWLVVEPGYKYLVDLAVQGVGDNFKFTVQYSGAIAVTAEVASTGQPQHILATVISPPPGLDVVRITTLRGGLVEPLRNYPWALHYCKITQLKLP